MGQGKKRPKVGKRKSRRLAQRRAQRLRRIRYGSLALLFLAAVAFALYRTSTAPEIDVPDEIMVANIDGPLSAPVKIVEFGDFGCPSCRAWHNSGIKPVLLERFGDQISFTFRHFPVITLQSPQAAEASQCAAEQGRFWDYHDYIYESTSSGALAVEDLKRYAEAIGLNTEQFGVCVDSGKYRDYVNRDREAAVAAGARGTPTFIINGQPAPFSFEGMVALIEYELNT